MQPSKVKLLFILAVIIYGCSSPNNTVTQQNPQISASSTILPSEQNSSPSSIVIPIKPEETAVPVKQLSTLEIKSITDSGIVGANNKFAFDIFSELIKKDSKKNIFISPASLSFALTMAYNGADKETKEAMGKVLHIGNLDLNTVNNANKLLLNKLKNPSPDINLEIANSLWGNKNVDFIPDFIKNNKEFYDADSNILDFGNKNLANENAKKMNDWISNNTNNRIKDVISPDELSNDTLMYLINAIYFKANWTYKFKKEDTKVQDFYLVDRLKQHPMMHQFNRFKYLPPNSYKSNKFQAIELPYGNEGKVSMYILLPSDDSNLDELYKIIFASDFNFDDMIKVFYTEGGLITLPKFKISDSYASNGNYMNDYLSSLGMKIAFNEDKANFFKMAKPESVDGNIYLSYVGHIANADINEDGTEAAAVTVVAASTQVSSEPMRTLEMRVDHPFFFMIRDNETKQILFMGSVTDPQL